jgi:DNA-binding MarR family transcriptional regulator
MQIFTPNPGFPFQPLALSGTNIFRILNIRMRNKLNDNDEERIVSALRRIIRAVDVYSRELSARYSLTGPQVMCLRELARNGEIPLGAQASAISLSPATVTGIVDRLEQKELVSRRRRQSDRRSVAVGLTPRGRTLVRRAPAPLQERFARRLEALPAGQREHISEVLQQIVSMMEPEALDPALAGSKSDIHESNI